MLKCIYTSFVIIKKKVEMIENFQKKETHYLFSFYRQYWKVNCSINVNMYKEIEKRDFGFMDLLKKKILH